MANRKVDTKNYYWLKLPKDFFNRIAIKKIKKSENGDKKINIYMQLLLETINKGGYFEYQHIENDICGEIAIVLDEDAEIIRELSRQLIEIGLIQVDDGDYYFPEAVELTGKRSPVADRVAKSRKNKKEKEKQEALQCNTNVTEGNAQVTSSNTNVTHNREEKSREEKEESKKRDRVNKEVKNKKRGEIVREGGNNNTVEYLDMFRNNVGNEQSSKHGYSDFTGIVEMFNEICKSFEHIDNPEEYTEIHSSIFIDCVQKGYSEEDYRKAFNIAENNDYLKGKTKNKTTCSELSWMLENLDKILGNEYRKYGNKKGKTA